MVAGTKLSEITDAPTDAGATDKLVGVRGGTTDYLYSLAQIVAGVAAPPQYAVQFNNPLGTFDGDADLTFIPSTGLLNAQLTGLGTSDSADLVPNTSVTVLTGETTLGSELVTNGTFAGNLNNWGTRIDSLSVVVNTTFPYGGWSYGSNSANFSVAGNGAVVWADANSSGTGYLVNDVLTMDDSGDQNATVTVTSIGGSGEVTGVAITTPGTGYAGGASSPSGGSGTGVVIFYGITSWLITTASLGLATETDYQVSFTIGGTTGSVDVQLGGTQAGTVAAGSGTATINARVGNVSDDKLSFQPVDDTFDGIISNVSVKQLFAGHNAAFLTGDLIPLLFIDLPSLDDTGNLPATLRIGSGGEIIAVPSDGGDQFFGIAKTDDTSIIAGMYANDLTASRTIGFPDVDGTFLLDVGSGNDGAIFFRDGAGANTNGNLTWASPALILGVESATTGILKFAGATSGVVSVQAQDAAGTWTFKWPATDGTPSQFLQTDGSGVTTWATPTATPPGGSNTQVQFNNSSAFGGSANLTWVSPALTIGVTGATTGLLKLAGATSGVVSVQSQDAAGTWTLQLPATDGTPNQFLQTDGDGITTWATPTGTAPGGSNTQVQFNNSSAFGGSANLTWVSPALTIGVSTSTTGILKLAGGTSGVVSVQAQDAAGTWTLQLPATDGNANEFLQTDGSGVTTWAAATTAPAGSNTQVQFNNSSAFGASANLTWVSPALTLGVSTSTTGILKFAGGTSGVVTVQAQDAAGTWTFKWPDTDGNANEFLQTNGSGVTTWAAAITAPAGSNTQVQFNNSSAFGASANLTWVSPALTLGVSTSTTGILKLAGGTSGVISVQAQDAAGTWTLKLPTTDGNASEFLQTDGSGVTTWAAVSASPGGSNTQVQFNNSSAFGGSANLTWVSPTLTLGVATSTTGILQFSGATSGVVSVQAQDAAGTWTFKWPANDGDSGQFLQTNGSGVTTWAAASAAPGGSDTQVQFNNSSSFGGSANLTWVSPALTIGASGATGQLKMMGTTSGTVTIQTQDVAGTWTLKWPADDGAANQMLLTDGSGVTSWAGALLLSVEDQTLAGGCRITSKTQSAGNITIDCGDRPLQYMTNSGAFTLTAPANDGHCLLLVTNDGSAGTITFSGFSIGASAGDPLTTTNGDKFTISIWRINSVSGYRVAAMQ